jgi:hypothetical protein
MGAKPLAAKLAVEDFGALLTVGCARSHSRSVELPDRTAFW